MNQTHTAKIAAELSLATRRVAAAAELLEDGATVPFIARYRKEATGTLDEVAITAIRDRLARLRDLDARRDTILKSIEEQGKLTDDLTDRIMHAETLAALEDIYLPYRPKRRTRATIAREKGLEPLAKWLFTQDSHVDPLARAIAFVDPEKAVESAEDALAGARDIIAEWVSENQTARARMRDLYSGKGAFDSKVTPGKEADGIKYENYFDRRQSVAAAPSHRILAMRRGEKEGFLRLKITVPEQDALAILCRLFIKGHSPASEQVRIALTDGYKRLLAASMETEIRLDTKQKADRDAIKIFAENLRQLLMAPPLGQKNVMAIDPGFRTGCKLVCLDRQGKLLCTDVIFPFQGPAHAASDAAKVQSLCDEFDVEAIAIGNGTAGRETEAFVAGIKFSKNIPVIMVNESGASVYSASPVAREEFPDHDVTVRGAASIGRRLMDPLAELVKIDPKSIGVGQYQHDVDQAMLKQGLDDVVTSCVNNVGVELNTASTQLLTYVSGLGPQLARNIVDYRNEHGPFSSRRQLAKVPRLGPKAFEQAAGFLRIRDAQNPLDSSAVHPESYHIVDAMAADARCSVAELMTNEKLRKKIDPKKYITDTVGLPTLTDILQELTRPGRDPRSRFELFRFADGIEKIEDLSPGMRLPGIVTNITAFGVFVDIGVHHDGLVHISQLADRFVKDPADVVKVRQRVTVTVLEVDVEKKRISLSMKQGRKTPPPHAPDKKTQTPSKKTPPPERLIDRLRLGS